MLRILSDLLIDISLCYELDEGPHSYRPTCGVVLGFVLCPHLWIIMTGDLLTGVVSIGFTDDIGVKAVARLL